MEKINDRTARIGVIGLECVGLPLSMAFSKQFGTIGYDVYEKCITNLRSGKSHILDVADTTFQKYVNSSFTPTNISIFNSEKVLNMYLSILIVHICY